MCTSSASQHNTDDRGLGQLLGSNRRGNLWSSPALPVPYLPLSWMPPPFTFKNQTVPIVYTLLPHTWNSHWSRSPERVGAVSIFFPCTSAFPHQKLFFRRHFITSLWIHVSTLSQGHLYCKFHFWLWSPLRNEHGLWNVQWEEPSFSGFSFIICKLRGMFNPQHWHLGVDDSSGVRKTSFHQSRFSRETDQ